MTPDIYLGALALLLLGACDPAGQLRVAVVRDGAGPVREPIADASVWLDCPIGGRTKLGGPMAAPGQFFMTRIPAIDLDCVLTVETPDGGGGQYRVRDICVDSAPSEGYGCKKAFLYVPVGRGPGG